MSSTATLAPFVIGDLKDWSFPIESMTCASCVFGEHWAINDLFWAFSYNVVVFPLAALAEPGRRGCGHGRSAASAWSPTP